MSTYQYNLNALQRSNPELAEKVRRAKENYAVRTLPTKTINYKTCIVKVVDKEWLLLQ